MGYVTGVQATSGSLGGPALFTRRTGDATARNSSNTGSTLTSDDTLLWTVGASDVWFVEGFLLVSAANTTMDFKVGWSLPTGATLAWGAAGGAGNSIAGFGGNPTTGSPIALKTAAQSFSVGSAAVTFGQSIAGVYTGDGSHAGTVTLQWAQDTSDAGNLVLLTNSFLRCSRIA